MSTKDAQHTLGQLLDKSAGRDAVHIALAPVIAGEELAPGDHIGFLKEGDLETVGSSCAQEWLGIADPFLTGAILPGERFWMFLYPNTISGLSHVWVHPAFPEVVQVPDPPADIVLPTKGESEEWLRAFVAGADCPGYEDVIKAATNDRQLEYGEGGWIRDFGDECYLFFYGMDAHGEIPDLFWIHLQNLTGKAVPKEKQAKAFSCSC